MQGLQEVLATAAIALSAFSLITYLWLGLTVLLLGNRRASITWVGGVGLLIAALFFLCHGALVGAGPATGAGPADLWWHLSWLPAFAAPLCWAAIGLHYIVLSGRWGRLRVLALAGVAALGGVAALLALADWDAIGSYGDFVRLLSVVLLGRAARAEGAADLASPVLPALAIAFVAYIGACACLPWAALVARRVLPGLVPRASAADGEPALLWDAGSAWARARPALFAASLCMLAAGAVVGLVGVITSVVSRHVRQHAGVGAPLRLPAAAPAPGHLPLALVAADLIVQGALAGLVLMLGWAVVRQGILVERRLPQRGFLGHWRGTVAVAGVVAGMVAWLSLQQPASLPALLVLAAVMATTYTAFTKQSYAAHDRFLEQLRPFVASLASGSAGWLVTDSRHVEGAVEALFVSLCRDVLGASRGRLTLTAGHLRRTFRYRAPGLDAPALPDAHEWVLPVADEHGVVARLALGPRVDGAGYTSADLEVARACGQRILDAVGEFTAVQTIAQLARRRGLEAELNAALPRRKLHDEILPRLHLAMLHLEALRGRVAEGAAPSPVAPVARVAVAQMAGAAGAAATAEVAAGAALAGVVGELGAVHHDLAALLRAAPAAGTRRLEQGFCAALRAALEGEFAGAFDRVEWLGPEPAHRAADALPDIVADVLLGAAREALRNAGRHARGGDPRRALALRVALAADDRAVSVTLADDGVGLEAEPQARATAPGAPVAEERGGGAEGGARSGLLTHGALLSLVAGSLAVHSVPGAGTTVTLRVPRVLDADGR